MWQERGLEVGDGAKKCLSGGGGGTVPGYNWKAERRINLELELARIVELRIIVAGIGWEWGRVEWNLIKLSHDMKAEPWYVYFVLSYVGIQY